MERFYYQPFPLPTPTDPVVYAPSNEQSAWFAIVYMAACSDGKLSDEEREAFCQQIGSKELYKDHELLDYYYELMRVKDLLGPKDIIRSAAELVDTEYAGTLFCMVTETLLAKGYLTEQEEDLLDFIGEELALSSKTTDKITEVLLMKSKGNWKW